MEMARIPLGQKREKYMATEMSRDEVETSNYSLTSEFWYNIRIANR